MRENVCVRVRVRGEGECVFVCVKREREREKRERGCCKMRAFVIIYMGNDFEVFEEFCV
jgi:hypothetical protein